MPNTIVDVTDLVSWQGRLTGVPRVMNELAQRLDSRDDVLFVTWDSALNSYLKTHIDKMTIDKPKERVRIAPAVANGRSRRILYRALKKLLRILKIRNYGQIGAAKHRINPETGDKLFVLSDWHGGVSGFTDYLINRHNAGVYIVVMSYDMLPIVKPEYSGHATEMLTDFSKKIYPISKIIFTISENTKKDIQKWLKFNKLSSPTIKSFRLGDDFSLSEPTIPVDQTFIDSGLTGKDYLLVVGTIEARKNHALLYCVYKLARSRQIELPKLVIVGRKGWLADNIYEMIHLDLEIKDQFIVLEATSDENLSWLYRNAIFTIYPSFYEGWGLPIAESIAHGTPCICSNTSSMPEVAGDLVGYFNPYSTDECLQKIQELLNPVNLEKAVDSIKKYKYTSWDDTYRYIMKALDEI